MLKQSHEDEKLFFDRKREKKNTYTVASLSVMVSLSLGLWLIGWWAPLEEDAGEELEQHEGHQIAHGDKEDGVDPGWNDDHTIIRSALDIERYALVFEEGHNALGSLLQVLGSLGHEPSIGRTVVVAVTHFVLVRVPRGEGCIAVKRGNRQRVRSRQREEQRVENDRHQARTPSHPAISVQHQKA